jgi:UDP-glucose 4-epimerase
MGMYLVTGIAGFIGSNLARILLSKGHQVIGVDNLSTGYIENVPQDAVFFHANCQDEALYNKLPHQKYDAIFHIAGQSSGEISFEDPLYDLQTNTAATLLLLKFAMHTSTQRFIYASTMSVYGNALSEKVNEQTQPAPVSFYGVGKLASERYLNLYMQYGIQPTSLRLFNVYGAGQNLSNLKQGMVSIYLAQMIKNQYIHVKGGKERFRDFIYIDDVLDACISCLTHPESIGTILNIGTGIKTTVKELISLLTAQYKHNVQVNYSGSTPGDVHGIYADISLAKKILDFEPKFTLSQGIKTMLAWATSIQHNVPEIINT